MSDLIIEGEARPQVILPGTVFDAALKRVRWIFDEFDNHVSVSTSGGKDSTVVMELAAIVARERGLILPVHFLDQEAEYEATVEYIRYLRDERDDIDLTWYQIPFRLFNATSYEEEWSYVWDERLTDEEYIRPREPDSVHVNDFYVKGVSGQRQVDRFKELLHEINKRDGGAILTGMRCEESPTRRVFMTSRPTYKWVTWCSGGKAKDDHVLMHPVYDWSYRDVWKAIYENNWRYNTFYDSMFQYGVKLRNMRVSSFHHEQSMGSLDYLQEIEPKTWEAATRRLQGINTYGHIGDDIVNTYLSKRPYMFGTWSEYLEHLTENLIVSDEDRATFRRMQVQTERALPYVPRWEIVKMMLYLVMSNDVYGSKLNAWVTTEKHVNRPRYWDWWREQRMKDGSWPEIEAEEVGRAA